MPIKTSPKDFFLHLGATIALYASVIALIRLAFTVINRALPDQLSNYWSASEVIWPISMLIVLVPIAFVLEWLSEKDIKLNPAKSEIWIRRWRMYLTMFLTGATIAVSVIALINTYLSGEISSRFLWKVLAAVVISAVVFAYYILAKSSRPETLRTRKILAGAGLVMVLGAIVAGFVVVGSPADLRAYRFDDNRVNDLNSIQYQLVDHIRRAGKLPASLSDMSSNFPYSAIPVDPLTKDPYEYTLKSSDTFELCATFSRPSRDNPNKSYLYTEGGNENWSHEAGRACFERKIDPNQFLPTDNAPVRKPVFVD